MSDTADKLVAAIIRDVAELPGDDYDASEAMTVNAYDLRIILERNLEATRISSLQEQLARADLSRSAYARALEKMRNALTSVHDGMEDEGDRIYFGSTNHADDLRAAWHLADALHWDEILKDTQPKTPLATVNLSLQAEIERLRADREDLESMERRLTNGDFYEDYDEDLRLLGVFRRHTAALGERHG